MLDKLKMKLNIHDKKLYDISLIAICIGVLILIAGSEILSPDKKEFNKDIKIEEFGKEIGQYSYDGLEKKLSSVLSNVRGAGRVDVMITHDRSVERIFAYETKSNSSQRGLDEIEQLDREEKIAYKQDSSGARFPVLLKEIHPRAKGVIVIADGADDALVKENLSNALQVILNLPRHNVSVLAREY